MQVPPQTIERPRARNIRKLEFPEFLTPDLVESWADGIPLFDKTNPDNPEWRETPLVEIPMDRYNFRGRLFVKDEADLLSNPTGTLKDRAAWEIVSLYRDFARGLFMDVNEGELDLSELYRLKVPRFSLISSGNEAAAVATMFKKYALPPPKVLIDLSLPDIVRNNLLSMYCDLYEVDLSAAPLTGTDILSLTDNSLGEDITSSRRFSPSSVLYDWLSHELLNKISNNASPRSKPRIYLPYGSGRLVENILYWQRKTRENILRGTTDPRFHGNVSLVSSTSVIGSQPLTPCVADKVYTPFRPFVGIGPEDIDFCKRAGLTGMDSGIEAVEDDYIFDAHSILDDAGIDAEPSAATGLALALKHDEQGLIKPGQPIFIVNTGKGKVNTPHSERASIRRKIKNTTDR